MHAYHRTEADQTDSIAVCATPEEWKIIAAVLDGTYDFAAIAGDLLDHLASVGVEVD